MQRRSILVVATWRTFVVVGSFALVLGSCIDDDTPFRQYTASDAVPFAGPPEPGSGGFEVQAPRLVDPRREFGDDFQLDTTDVVRFETPGLCDGCGAYVMSFSSLGWLEEAVKYFERKNEANGAAIWIIETRRNLLLLIDARWPQSAVDGYLTTYCRLTDECLEE